MAEQIRAEAEARELEGAFRVFALRFRQEGETGDAATARVRAATHLVVERSDPEWTAFYAVEIEWEKVVLVLNTAHAFWGTVLGPLEGLTKADDPQLAEFASSALHGLHVQLVSLGLAQSAMAANDAALRGTFDRLRRQWGVNLAERLNGH